MQKQKVIVIVGPTASGKTALSIELAKRINGEIISCDSMQIYKDMDIGTAKVTKDEMQDINHYLIDFVSPEDRYSVADYKKDAKNAIKRIIDNKKVPIIVGGTGLYINSLIYEIDFNEINVDLEYRKELEKEVCKKGLEYLYNKALTIDEEATLKISKNDEKRILRILEIYHATNKTKTELERQSRLKPVEYDYKIFAIDMDREILYDRINRRVDIMIQNGLIDEVKDIVKKYKTFPTAMQGLGYKEVVEYLDGKISKEEMIEKIKQESRRYAKRQLTWFRKIENVIWLNGLDKIEDNVDKIIKESTGGII